MGAAVALPVESKIVARNLAQVSLPFAAPDPAAGLSERLQAGEEVTLGPTVLQVLKHPELVMGSERWVVRVTYEGRTFPAVDPGSTVAPRTRDEAVAQALLLPSVQSWFLAAWARGPVTRDEVTGTWFEGPPTEGDPSGRIVLSYYGQIENQAFPHILDGIYAEVRREIVSPAPRNGRVTYWVDCQSTRLDWTRRQFNLGRRVESYDDGVALVLRWIRLAQAFLDAPACSSCGEFVAAGVVTCTPCAAAGSDDE